MVTLRDDLPQIVLTRKDTALASSLLGAYLSLFRQQMLERKDLENKTLTAILTGINRALPFATNESDAANGAGGASKDKGAGGAEGLSLAEAALGEHMDNIFKMVYVSTFNTSVQALQVLYQATAAGGSGTPSGRFYQALYAKLAAPDLRASSKHSLFLNLLHRACKADPHAGRCKAFVKRLLQVAASSPVPFACGALYLASALLVDRPQLWEALPRSNTEVGAAGGPAGGPEFREGDEVSIHSLKQASQFNGRAGRVESFDGERFAVHIDGLEELLRVRPANLHHRRRPGRAGGVEGDDGNGSGGFRPGDMVLLQGLVSAAHLNGFVAALSS